ncbi:VOC family protein [Sinanaerobacter chloroacetimidivorans]|jgi:lactoylglutathione lyase|uniref:VOC family protein n=1 Tax=Sinanaerobacter chloroacetimidivorans TaxID=2818044 RepID=A0A8J7W3H4_9FIRM|nr:VOC family protein [Sinanaerobacter chloroacetimidivorans]MBR0598693.1 VOC family protein [Sinanaerobacter chloroacetimidivorans]
MKLCWVTITVNDMEESLNFYQNIIGLPFIQSFQAGPEVQISFLGDKETKIELICNGKKPQIGQDISLGFEVPSIDEKIQFLKEQQIALHSGPFQPNPHTKFFFILDPSGVKIQFVETI